MKTKTIKAWAIVNKKGNLISGDLVWKNKEKCKLWAEDGGYKKVVRVEIKILFRLF